MKKRKWQENSSPPLEEKKSIFILAEAVLKNPAFTKRLKELGKELRDRTENPRAALNLVEALNYGYIKSSDQIIYTSILEDRLSELKKSHVLSLQAECNPLYSPLGWAAQMGRLNVVEFLLKDQSKKIVTSDVLQGAIRGGNLAILKALFQHVPNLLASMSDECEKCVLNALRYGATHVLAFLFEKIWLTQDEKFLLKYIILLNSLGGFNFSSILSNYKKEEKTILDSWITDTMFFEWYIIRWCSLEFLQHLLEDYPHSFERYYFSGKNILHLAIEYGRDLSIIKMLSKQHRKCVFESIEDKFPTELPLATASKMGNLDALQHLIGFECTESDVSNKYFRINYQDPGPCVYQAMVNGHTHILDYIKNKYSIIWKEKDFYSDSLTAAAQANEGKNLLKVFQWYGEQFVCEWRDLSGSNLLHRLVQIQNINVPAISWVDRAISKKISKPWEAKNSVDNTPLGLAFRYKSASLFYVFALGLPLDQYQQCLNSDEKIRTMWNEYNESLSSFLSLYYAIWFSPRYGKLTIELMNYIFEYIAEKPSEMALMEGLKYFRQALLAKTICKIYGDGYQAHITKDTSAISDQMITHIAQNGEINFSARSEASEIVRLASCKFTPEQEKRLEINVSEENKLIARTIWFYNAQKGYNFILMKSIPSTEQMKPFTFYFDCEAGTEAPVLKYALLDEKGLRQMGEIKNPVDSKELPTLRDSFTKLATLIKNLEPSKGREATAILRYCFSDIIKSIQTNGHTVPLDKRAGKYPTKADSRAYAVSLAKWWGKRGSSLSKGGPPPPRPEFRYLSLEQ